MSTQNWFILTAAETVIAKSLNSETCEIDPRLVDNSSPGVGINLNPSATNYLAGAAVDLVGTGVAPKRIVDNPEYPQAMKTYLLTLPFATLESETIFMPVAIEG